MAITDAQLQELCNAYGFPCEHASATAIYDGHINNTYRLDFLDDGTAKQYLIQQINDDVFLRPITLMSNIVAVTNFLQDQIKEHGGDPEREALRVIPTLQGKDYLITEKGDFWRCYNFITNAYTCNAIENPKIFYNAAIAFGNFQKLLAQFPADDLHETIPDFHNTAVRYETFENAFTEDVNDRVKDAMPEIEFVKARKNITSRVVDLLDAGNIPVRVTHNDTKLNNVMFDRDTDEGVCVIDLDTVMPGSALYDFGDAIRFGANTAVEDEKDTSKVSLDLNLFKEYTRGYLESAGSSLVKEEINNLVFSAILMTFECGIRFLTDFLSGDTYFKTAYNDHNLVRSRTQFKLVEDMENKTAEMQKIVEQTCHELKL